MSYHPVFAPPMAGLGELPSSPEGQFAMGTSLVVGLGLVAIAAWMFLRSDDEPPPRRFDNSRYGRPEDRLTDGGPSVSQVLAAQERYGTLPPQPLGTAKMQPGGVANLREGTYSPPAYRWEKRVTGWVAVPLDDDRPIGGWTKNKRRAWRKRHRR